MAEAQRWSVTYTKHVTQKWKVYHDGFLVLQSSTNKVMLYDEWDKLLDTRFVKKDDLIISGETVKFDSHLVDLGELCKHHQPTSNVSSQEKGNKVSEASSSFYSYSSQNKRLMVGKSKRRVVNLSPSKKMIRDFKTRELIKLTSPPKCMDMTLLSTKGKPPGNISEWTNAKLSDSIYKTENAKLSRGDAETRRSVSDILSILRQPSDRKVVPVNKPVSQNCAQTHSSEFQSDTKNNIKEYAEECNGTAREELREKMSDHDGMIKVIKSEPFETVIDDMCGVSGNGRVSQAMPSSFHPRSQTVMFISPIHDVKSINLNELMSSSSHMESHAAVTAALSCDGQKEIVSESPTRSYAKEQWENPPIISSCEEIMTETNAAKANGLSSSKLPELQEDKNGSSSRCNDDRTSNDLNTEDMDDFPSFDLGI